MTTDTNLSQIVFNRLSNEKYHELKTSGQLNDQQFYITPDLDTNPGLIQDYMSNCITKIPQHINLELSTDGTLTLKAGSKVYVPNGLDETTPKFDYITVETDVNINNYGTGNTDFFLCYDFANNSLLANANTNSGNTEITSEGFNYNISTNKITFYGITGNIVSQNVSFPIALCSRSSGTPTSIDQVFNGIGYIGAVAFAVPGVQVIIPNGFNSNGQLNNYTATVERVLTNDYANGNLLGHNYPLTLTNSPLLSAGDLIYVEEENQIYKSSIAELNKRTEVEIAKVTTDSTRITSLTPLPIYNRILGSYQTSTSNNIIGNHIGQIGYTTRTDVPEGCAWCDGAEYTQKAFPDIYQMLVDGRISSTDYTTFEDSISTNGSCGFFGLNSDTASFKVPKLSDAYIKAGQAPSMFGAESLPNIKGIFSGRQIALSGGMGAFYDGNNPYGGIGSGSYNNEMNFDASRSSSAYQDGAKVNPDHVVYRAYVVLYSSAAEASVAQAQEFMTALGNKANVGLDNITAEAKDLIAGLGMPSDKYIDMDIQASRSKYTAPADGYFTATGAVEGSLVSLVDVATNLGTTSGYESGVVSGVATIQVKKGREVMLIYRKTPSIFRFVYAEGSKE